MEKGDRDLWKNKNHRNVLFEAGVTPNFLVKQYNHAHKYKVIRMTHYLWRKGFNPKQVTA